MFNHPQTAPLISSPAKSKTFVMVIFSDELEDFVGEDEADEVDCCCPVEELLLVGPATKSELEESPPSTSTFVPVSQNELPRIKNN